MRRTLCVWLPNWPVQRLTLAQAELKGRAVVLCEPRRNVRRVAACSAEAAALGVRIGMPAAEAAALVGQEDVGGRAWGVGGSAWGVGSRGWGVGRGEGGGRKAEGGERDYRLQIEDAPRSTPHAPPPTPHVPLPTVHLFPSDPAGDRAALEELAVWCSRFSPAVGVEEAAAPDSLLLDITGLSHLLGDEPTQAARVLAALAGRGLAARIGVADTPGAAWAAARWGVGDGAWGVERGEYSVGRGEWGVGREEGGGRKAEGGERDCILKIDDRKLQIADAPRPTPHAPRYTPHAPRTTHCPLPTAHCSILPPGQSLAAMAPLPVEALRLSGETVGLLHSLGVYQVGQLARLPRQDLAARFGAGPAGRLDQALGLLPEPIRACGEPPELRAEWSLEYPAARRAAVEAVVEQLVVQLAARLVRHGRGALRLECRLDCQTGPPVNLSVGLYQATASAAHLAGLVRMQLERVRLPAPVTNVRVEAAISAPLEHRQQSLFDDELARRRRDLAGLIDRLASRLGPRSVLRARLVADAQPELAVCYDNLQSLSPPSALRPPRSPRPTPHAPRTAHCPLSTIHSPPPRPLRLLARPAALVATSVLPEGPPVQFQFEGLRHRVARTWGPERIETGWWRGQTVGRDYYRVETTVGRRFWLYRRLRDGKWFLHGMFE